MKFDIMIKDASLDEYVQVASLLSELAVVKAPVTVEDTDTVEPVAKPKATRTRKPKVDVKPTPAVELPVVAAVELPVSPVEPVVTELPAMELPVVEPPAALPVVEPVIPVMPEAIPVEPAQINKFDYIIETIKAEMVNKTLPPNFFVDALTTVGNMFGVQYNSIIEIKDNQQAIDMVYDILVKHNA